MTESIDEFRGKYFFLSNFYSAPVEYQGYRFENNEAAFQAAKCPEQSLPKTPIYFPSSSQPEMRN